MMNFLRERAEKRQGYGWLKANLKYIESNADGIRSWMNRNNLLVEINGNVYFNGQKVDRNGSGSITLGSVETVDANKIPDEVIEIIRECRPTSIRSIDEENFIGVTEDGTVYYNGQKVTVDTQES
ncbi:hypothetical protein KC669_01965 [Candidatus Dojkabacteria bacterium]|uniref:Uncharacterized protein n=1 Tax=Candidatus Dojkabacteria bacterium TaxID=2099670 RepID=A0A955LAW3_9BACT|nr:hypothetical protein [Candidatus Dojkabacteria bacterium]